MTETELCKNYINFMWSLGFQSYPETSGYDFVLLKNKITFGIQAKLVPNLKVIEQLVKTDENVDFKIALLGKKPKDNFINILHQLRILPIYWDEYRPRAIYNKIYYKNPLIYFRRKKIREIYLPNFIPDLPAGVRSPKTIMELNVLAVKLELACNNGYVSTQIARDLGLKRVPKQYFRFDFREKMWYCYNKPSKKFPHIYEGLTNYK